ncbi:MAG: hypothetical protein KQH53_18155 [Desulfarculaceae bacterium]|nr:hypothetical protein [Desulfarculaceae bacterium]
MCIDACQKPKSIQNEKLFYLYSLIPNWVQINALLSGLVGKAFFVISLSVPIAWALKIGINVSSFRLVLLGAVICSFCYFISVTLSPPLVKKFSVDVEYARVILEMYNARCLNVYSHFNQFDLYLEANSKIIKYHLAYLLDILPVENAMSLPNVEKFIHMAAVTQFNIENNKFWFLRLILIILFVSGILLINYNVLEGCVGILFKSAA